MGPEHKIGDQRAFLINSEEPWEFPLCSKEKWLPRHFQKSVQEVLVDEDTKDSHYVLVENNELLTSGIHVCVLVDVYKLNSGTGPYEYVWKRKG